MKTQTMRKQILFVTSGFVNVTLLCGVLAGCSPAGSSGAVADAPVPATVPAPPAVPSDRSGQFVAASSETLKTQNGYKATGVAGTQESQISGTTQGGYKVFMTIKGAEVSKPTAK